MSTADNQRSRPLRLAVQLTGTDEIALARVFSQRVALRLADDHAERPDARETFLFAANQILRFSPNLSVSLPAGAHELAARVGGLARAILGPGATIPVLRNDDDAAITLTVGGMLAANTPAVAVNSSGWCARMITSAGRASELPEPTGAMNPIGALAAACQGVGQVFMGLAGTPLEPEPVEFSLFERTSGILEEVADGPALPSRPLDLDALLVGCGAVMNGFAYAAARLPMRGRARAVDRQRLRRENNGPYVLSTLGLLGTEKTGILQRALAPRIKVTTYPEEFDPLFTVRLERLHFAVPPMVIAGLDNVVTRHTVQRLWPRVLIDMGASGATAQVILKRRDEHGMCLLEALRVPASERANVERISRETGLGQESVRAMDSPISKQDVIDAPVECQDALETARKAGVLRCGFIRTRALDHEQPHRDFAAAAPFVVAYSGVIAAAEAMKELMGINQRGSMRHQTSFVSLRTRTVSPRAQEGCECNLQPAAGQVLTTECSPFVPR